MLKIFLVATALAVAAPAFAARAPALEPSIAPHVRPAPLECVSHEKGDSRHAWLLALPLIAACGHGPVLSVAKAAELTALACDAQTKCQRHADRSDENFPDLPVQDRACILLANEWSAAAKAVCK